LAFGLKKSLKLIVKIGSFLQNDPHLSFIQDQGQTATAFSQNAELTSLLVAYEASWKYKNQPRAVQRRASLHHRMSMKAIEEFSTQDFDADAPSGVRVEEDTPLHDMEDMD
jgi:hypothetical protein